MLDKAAPPAQTARMMSSLFQVALGGAVGASLRFLVGQTLAFPLATLAVNIVGSLAIGLLWVVLQARGLAQLAPLLITGVLGGFTTFSAFSLDTLRLVEQGRVGLAGGYVIASVALSILACGAGLWFGRSMA